MHVKEGRFRGESEREREQDMCAAGLWACIRLDMSMRTDRVRRLCALLGGNNEVARRFNSRNGEPRKFVDHCRVQ